MLTVKFACNYWSFRQPNQDSNIVSDEKDCGPFIARRAVLIELCSKILEVDYIEESVDLGRQSI